MTSRVSWLRVACAVLSLNCSSCPWASLARRSGRTSCGCRARTTALSSARTAIATAPRRPWTHWPPAGVRFTRAWAAAPVCAPSRTAIITGVLQQTTGGMHMRSEVPLRRARPHVPGPAARGRLLHDQQREGGLQPPDTPPGVWDESSADGALARAARQAALLRRVQQRDHAREPDPEAAAHGGARPGVGARAAVSPRHARSAAGLGAVLRQALGNGRRSRGCA